MKPWLWQKIGVVFVVLGGAQAAEPPPSALFDLSKVHKFHLQIPAAEWEAMQAVGSSPFMFGAAPKPDPSAKPMPPRADRHKGAFGYEFPWGRGTLSAGGQTYEVGLRFKGNSAYMTAGKGPKRPFKVDFDRVDPAGRFYGLKALNFNNNALDPTQLREVLSFAAFRAAGVPAPRTGFAEVTLTVPGKYQNELLGLYTLIEEVDKSFLKDRFGKAGGMLLKPEVRLQEAARREPIAGIDDLGDQWPRYAAHFNPKNEVNQKQAARLIAFARLVGSADDATFRKEIGSYLDVDRFLRYVAVNALLVNLDSYIALGHNYYIYLDPVTNRFVFIPWDLNLSFAGLVMGGTVEQMLDLSLMHPHWGENPLIDRLLAIPEIKDSYRKVLAEITTTSFTRARLQKELDTYGRLTKELIERDKAGAKARKDASGFPMFVFAPTMEKFSEKRFESIAAQLAGKSKGYVPVNLMRPGQFIAGLSTWPKPLREALDANNDNKVSSAEFLEGARRLFAVCDQAKSGRINEKQLTDGINSVMPRAAGAAALAGPFSPGVTLGGAVLRHADENLDGWITRDELLAAAAAHFDSVDKQHAGALDEKQLEQGIKQLFERRRIARTALTKPAK